ncbi:MAG: protein translocase subunit SecD [Micrococcales bacterium]|nr:protein translocase subunit SecD [Micrococcales bacterium]
MIGALGASIFGGNMWSDATLTPKLGLDLEGGTQIILTPVTETPGDIPEATINEAIGIIRQRVDASGVAEAQISSQGGNKIVVALPGRPSEETLDLVRRPAQMEFRAVLAVGAPTPVVLPGEEGTTSEGAGEEITGIGEETGTEGPTEGAGLEEQPPAQPGEPSSPSDAAYYITPQVQQEFDELDCTDEKNLTGGLTGPTDTAFVTCNLSGTEKYILGPVEVKGSDISTASSGLETLASGQVGSRWVVSLQFNNAGTTSFATISERLFGMPDPQNRFGIVLDGLVVSAPSMNAVISDGRAEISGSFTRESAATLAQQLNFGSLPITFTVESEQRISATLGSEQLARGLLAGLIGLVLVVIYSLAQYRVLGLLSVASLTVAGLLTYGIITLLSWTQGYRLSLAGVAGLIVAIGITADSFIVYFERIRDELRDGRVLAVAVDHGWKRARRTILASDAINFSAAIVLYTLAVGNVQGFAFTLGLTTLIDLVMVFLFTHPMMKILARRRFFAEGHPWSGLDPRRLGVETTRYVGRGRVRRLGSGGAQDAPEATVPDEAGGSEPSDASRPSSGSRPVSTGAAPGAASMTIAERRAAARKAAQDEPTDDEGEVR